MSTTKTSLPFIVAFYDPTLNCPDASNRTHPQILKFPNVQLESQHDYIQYLFPLPGPSPVNPHAPTISPQVRRAFLSRPELREQLQKSLDRMLSFYGFTAFRAVEQGVTSEFRRADDFESRSRASWRMRFGHNHLRITRILRCLRVLGLEGVAGEFHEALKREDVPARVGSRTWEFWRRAVERPLWLPPEAEEGEAGCGWLREELEGREGGG